jgi:hypothetical protein
VIFGVQPQSVDFGPDLSPAVASGLDRYAAAVLLELKPDDHA